MMEQMKLPCRLVNAWAAPWSRLIVPCSFFSACSRFPFQHSQQPVEPDQPDVCTQSLLFLPLFSLKVVQSVPLSAPSPFHSIPLHHINCLSQQESTALYIPSIARACLLLVYLATTRSCRSKKNQPPFISL